MPRSSNKPRKISTSRSPKSAKPAAKTKDLRKSRSAAKSASMRNPTAEAHKKLLPLLKKREQLQIQMAELDDQIATALRNQSPGPIAVERRSGASAGSGKKAADTGRGSLSPKSGTKHGMLKEAILASLKKAGRKGLSIGEIAAQVGVLRANVQVWFSSTGRKVEGLEKVERGRWRYPAR